MAISFDSSGQLARSSTTSLSGSFTNTSGDALWVDIELDGTTSNFVTGVTYNGVSMTQIDTASRSGVIDVRIYTYFMIGPATGSNTLTVSLSSSANVRANAISYKGVKQTLSIDGQISSNLTNQNTNVSRNLTTIADNCWTRAVFYVSNNATLAAGTSTTGRQNNASSQTNSIFSVDSNAAITPAGESTLQVTFSGANIDAIILMQSFAPLTTNIKTVDGLAYASVKTADGLAVSSVKTIDGLA